MKKINIIIFIATVISCMIIFIKPTVSFAEQNAISSGWYNINTKINENISIDIKDGYADSFTRTRLWKKNNARAQKFYIGKNNDDSYSILTGSSGRMCALSIHNNQIWQIDYTGSDNQKWDIVYNTDGSVSFVNKSTGKAFDIPHAKAISGTELNAYSKNSSDAQKFILTQVSVIPSDKNLKYKSIENGWYNIFAKSNENIAVDIKDGYADSLTRTRLWKKNNARAQKFYFSKNADGSYSILTGSSGKNCALTVLNNQIWQIKYDENTDSQKWDITFNTDDTVSFVNRMTGKALDIPHNNATSGTELNVYTKNLSKAQKFTIKKVNVEPTNKNLKYRTVVDGWYIIKAKANDGVAVNVKDDYADSYTRAGLLDVDNGRQQKYYIKKNSDGSYSILTGSSDKAGALSSYKNQVWQIDNTDDATQKWDIEYNTDGSISFINKSDGRAMDIPYGKANSGAWVNVYNRNTSAGQKFVLTNTTAPAGTALKYKNIKDGWYIIKAKANDGVVVNVKDDYADSYTRAGLLDVDNGRQQKYYIRKNSDGSYSILTGSSDKAGALSSYKNQVWQIDNTDSATQKWDIEYNTDDSISFINKSDGRAMDIPYGKANSGAWVNVYNRNTSAGQKFVLTNTTAPADTALKYKNIKDGWYIIKAKANTGVAVNVKGDYADSYTRAGLLDVDNGRQQKYYIKKNNDGSYSILTGSSDKEGALSSYKNQVWQIDNTDDATQKWDIEYNTDDSISFINKSDGRAMDIPYGKANSGVWVNVYNRNTSAGQKFVLLQTISPDNSELNYRDTEEGWYTIKPVNNAEVSLDIKGGYRENYTRLQIFSSNENREQKYYFKKNSDKSYTILTGASNKKCALTEYNNQVWQIFDVGTNNQKWNLEYNYDDSICFKNKESGLVMDLPNAVTESGTYIGTYKNTSNTGQNFVLTKTSAPSEHFVPDYSSIIKNTEDPTKYGAVSNNEKYYYNGNILKGLQKLQNRWFLFDDEGKYSGESCEKIHIASFFQTDEKQDTKIYITLDGRIFHTLKNTLETTGRDMNVYAKNGIFYLLKTFYEDGDNHYDFAIHQTENFAKYKFVAVSGLLKKTNHFANWAPEWFIDDNGVAYVFYASEYSNFDSGDRKFKIFVTKVNDISTYNFDAAIECNFNDWNERTGNFIDPVIIKKGDFYYMIVKEGQHKGILYDGLLLYKSTNLYDWEYVDVVRNAFPRNLVDNFEGPSLANINGLYYLYADQYSYKETSNSFEYDNKIHYAVSNDLLNWQYMGTIDTQGFAARHGSVIPINDIASEQKIQSLMNS